MNRKHDVQLLVNCLFHLVDRIVDLKQIVVSADLGMRAADQITRTIAVDDQSMQTQNFRTAQHDL